MVEFQLHPLTLRKRGTQTTRDVSEVQLKSLLERRLARLMTPDQGRPTVSGASASAQTVEDAILDVSEKLNRPGWMPYMVGGTLRDLLVAPATHHSVQPRDIDIIVDGATRGELQEALSDSLQLERFTRFGGLHLSASLASGLPILFDVWTLKDTWGFHSQGISPRIQDFPGTTFLNIDSCATELIEPDGRERAVFEKGFFTSIASRVLDVNYAPNPYPYVCVVRALVLSVQLEFEIARPLARFILDHASAGKIEELLEAQQSHYGTVRSGARELEAWIYDLRRQFDSGQDFIYIEVPGARRLELWNDHPAAPSRRGSITPL